MKIDIIAPQNVRIIHSYETTGPIEYAAVFWRHRIFASRAIEIKNQRRNMSVSERGIALPVSNRGGGRKLVCVVQKV